METLKFKVGDKVRVKSLDWYNQNKDGDGYVYTGQVFTPLMSEQCGSILTIEEIYEDYYLVKENAKTWQDWMLEEAVEDIKKRELTKEVAQAVVRCTKYTLKSENENASLQKKLFEIGCKWASGGKEVANEDCKYLYVDKNLNITMGDVGEEDFYKEEPSAELSVNDVLNIEIKDITMETKEMTQEEVFAYLNNKKILCTSSEESTNVQQKLFELGIEWSLAGKQKFVDKYLLYIENNRIKYTLDFEYWVRCHQYKRIEPSEILAIKLKEEKPRFDPKTLRAFDKVLVRDCNTEKWRARFFDRHEECEECGECEYGTTCNCFWVYCIPYNEETKHLHGTTEEAPEFYRI